MGVSLRIGSCALALAMAFTTAGLATGCKESLSLKNVEHDQTAADIDHDSETKVTVAADDGKADENADTTSYKVVKKSKAKKQKKLSVVYASKNAESKLAVPQYLYDKNAKNDTEATKGVNPDKGTTGSSKSEQNQDEKDEGESKASKSTIKESKSSGKKSSKNGSSKKNKNSSGKKASKAKGKGDSSSEGAASKKGNGSGAQGEAKVYDTTGEDPELPDVSTVAACGAYATMVQMLGGQDGKTALVAADRDLLNSSFKTVFSDEGFSKIVAGWKDDGDDSSEADISALLKAKPDTVLVDDANYFTKKQSSKLAKNDISVTVMPTLTSATRIRTAVKNLGTMLDKATDGLSSSRASEYDDYHESLVKRVQAGNKQKNGYGRHGEGGKAYDADRTSQPGMYTSTMYSLYIGDWDYGATYTGTGSLTGAVTSKGSGVGLVTLGYRTSPVSYYMGVAGVVNNAAAIDESATDDGLLVPVWQFSTSVFKNLDTAISWSAASTSKRVMAFNGQAFSRVALTQASTKQTDISKKGFGSANFPKVIVKTEKMKKAFMKGSTGRGIYRPYGNDADGSTGFVYNGTYVYSTILTKDLEEDILVNPKGLFESWTDGSVESCLESAWMADVSEFGNGSGVDVHEEIQNFYSEFFRYDISDARVSKMLENSGV